jgi:type IV fimbrial biogenesis protein FimT
MTMKNMREKRLSNQGGFSLLELLVVVGLMMVLSAIAMPSVLQSVSVYRLSSTATSVQNLIEVARFNAVRRNSTVSFRQTTLNGQPAFYVDLTNSGAYATTDPVYLIPTYALVAPAGAPAANTTGLANTAALGNGCISFNSRGVVDYTTCGAGVQSVWFISLGSVNGTGGYRAITLTPMGQAKSWTASTGGNWGNM